MFERIEVVNRLRKEAAANTIRLFGVDYDKPTIFDRIHSEINQFCSRHSLEEVYITFFDRLDDDLLESLQTACDLWHAGYVFIFFSPANHLLSEII